MNLLADVSWFTPTLDLIVVLLLIAIAFLLGLALKRNKIIILLIGIYIAIAVVNFFPFGNIFDRPKIDEDFVYPVGIFIAIVLLFFTLLSRSGLKKAFSKSGDNSIFQIILFSLFSIGLLLSVCLSFFPTDLVQEFNPIVKVLFMAKLSRFLWALAPVFGVLMFKNKRKRRR